MQIRSDRVVLERISPALAARIVARDEQPGDRWHPEYPFVDELDPLHSLAEARDPDPDFTLYLLRRTGDGLAVGGLGFFAPPDDDGAVTLGYGLVPSARGRGLGTDAVRTALAFAGARGARRAEADTDVVNLASQRVLDKAGFRRIRQEGQQVFYARDLDGDGVRRTDELATVAAYDAFAAAYTTHRSAVTEEDEIRWDTYAAALPAGGSVLEIGSGPGVDAAALERRGLVVRRTDVSPGFVRLLRSRGVEADLLDPLVDPLGGPYDGVWANASLLHVRRDDLPVVLARLARAARPGAVLHLALKEGDGDGWSVHGSVRAARHFTYWREDALRTVLATAGWHVVQVDGSRSPRGESWLTVGAELS